MTKRKEEGRILEQIDVAAVKLPQDLQRLRVDEARIKELADSVSKVGLINPIIVQTAGKKYLLVAGYRRLLAFQRLQRETIPAFVLGRDEPDTWQITLDENFAREDVNVVEEAVWMKNTMRKAGLKPRGIAGRLGKSVSFVRERLAVIDYDDLILNALAAGRLGLKKAQTLMKCQDGPERDRILARVLEAGASQQVLDYWVEQANLALKAPDSSEEYLPPEDTQPIVYTEPEFICDFCSGQAKLSDSRLVRVCQSCREIARENLKAPKS